MRVALHHEEGKTLRLLDSRANCPCPECGTLLTLKKTRPSKMFEDSTRGHMVLTVNRYFACQKCGYRNKSTEWRPVGEKSCCEQTIQESNYPISSKLIKLPNLVRAWERKRSTQCLCGALFSWSERMVLDGD